MSLLEQLQDINLGGDAPTMTGKTIFGIDLGTTYSAIAYINDSGKPEVINNLDGDATTPSVIYFENAKKAVVGKHAKNALRTHPERVVHFIKRELKNAAYHFKPDEDGEDWTPITLSGLILKRLVEDANADGHDVKDVIITCPAYFGEDEHKAVRKAGEWAGLHVVRILDEPVAAALAYGAKLDEPKTILVYDLGGGTFDVTLVSVKETGVEVVLGGGNPRLGGKDWDEALLNVLVAKWQDTTNCRDDILSNESIKAALMLDAETAKTGLTRLDSQEVTIAPEGYDKATVQVTREEFDIATETLLNETITLTNNLLRDCGKKMGLPEGEKPTFDELVLVGGSTRMPQVAAKLEAEFGVKPKIGDPNLSVAKGAALRSLLPLDDEPDGQPKDDPSKPDGPQGPVILECLGHSYGLAAYDNGTKICFNMLLRGQPMTTAQYMYRFSTKVPQQRTIDIEIAESDEGIFEATKEEQARKVEFDRVSIIQSAKLMLPPGLPAHDPVEVTFSVDSDKILHVNAVHVGSGEAIEVKVEGRAIAEPQGNFDDTGITI